eukprot:359346-Chlamydomonas_euryale.AAC.6
MRAAGVRDMRAAGVRDMRAAGVRDMRDGEGVNGRAGGADGRMLIKCRWTKCLLVRCPLPPWSRPCSSPSQSCPVFTLIPLPTVVDLAPASF